MRCIACDALLKDREIARINPHTGEMEDLCTRCLKDVAEVSDLTKLPYYEEIVGFGDCC